MSEKPAYRSPAATAPRLVAYCAAAKMGTTASAPERVAHWRQQAGDLRGQGRLQAAIGMLQRALPLTPEDPTLYQELAALYQDANLPGRAAQMTRQAAILQARPQVETVAATTTPASGTEASRPATPPAPTIVLTRAQRREAREAMQRMLVRMSRVCADLAEQQNESTTEVVALRDHLKTVLLKSAPPAEPRIVPAPLPVAQGAAVQPLAPDEIEALAHDLGPAGQAGRVYIGPEVALLQRLLHGLGWPLAVSGRFDHATLQAVRQFQTQHRLPRRDGVVDATTRQLLRRQAIGGVAPVVIPQEPGGVQCSGHD